MSTMKQRPGTASSRDLLAVAEGMLPEIREAADAIDEARRVPDWLADKLAANGFFHLLTGPEYGGKGADPVTSARVIETLATASPSVAWVTMILASSSFWTVRMVPPEVRREMFADVTPGGIQPSVLAGTLVPHGRAVRAEGGWRLTGQWPFGSGCHHATWLPSAAWLHDDGGPITDENGTPQWRVFHLPASDCVILDTWYTSGLRGTGSTDYAMDGVFVADSYIKKHSLLEPPALADRRYTYAGFNVPSLSAVALGAARGAVDSLVELFGGKVDRRNQRPVASAYDKQADLGIAAATVDSARAYLYDTTSRAWEVIQSGRGVAAGAAGRACGWPAPTRCIASVDAVDRVHLGRRSDSSIYSAHRRIDRFFRDAHSRGGSRLRAADHHGRRRAAAAGPGTVLPGVLA